MVLILDEPLLESMLKSVLRGTSKALHLEGAFTPYLQYRMFLM